MPCKTVNVQAEPDESTLSVSVGGVESPQPNTITLQYTVSNEITSGNGETLSANVETTVAGNVVDQQSVSVAAGATQQEGVVIENVGSGQKEVCVNIV